MTDKKISELTSITGANVSDANDVLPIVDTSVATTKKITRAELFKSVSSVDINGGTIDGTVIGGSTPAAISGTTGTFSGNLTVDTDTLFVDATGNRVGIGTSSPAAKIHSVSAVAADAAQFSDGTSYTLAVRRLTSSTGGMLTGTAGSALGFGTNNTERMRITSSGNLGLGVVPSVWYEGYEAKAFQFGPAGALWSLATSSSDRRLTIDNNSYINISGVDTYVADGAATRYQTLAGVHRWYTAPSGTAGNAITFTQAMTLDASGKLLVGTTTSSAGRIVSVGNVAGSIYTLISDQSLYGTGSVGHILFTNGNGSVGSIATSGSSTSYNTSSDYRLKEDVQPMVGATDRLMALKPVNFAWKADGSRVDGFIAHEAQEVVPEAVTGSKDAVDKDGAPEYQGIDHSKLLPVVVAALQEALTEIEDLKARVAALEA